MSANLDDLRSVRWIAPRKPKEDLLDLMNAVELVFRSTVNQNALDVATGAMFSKLEELRRWWP